MLQRAAAADAEMRTARRRPRGVRAFDAHGARERVAGLLPRDLGVDPLARQRAFDEHDLAVGVRDAAAFLVQRFDRELGHAKGANCTRRAGVDVGKMPA